MTDVKRRRIYLACQIVGWSLHAVINIGFAAVDGGIDPRTIVLIVWADALAGFCSHLFRAWILRHGWLALSLPRLIPRVFAGSFVCGAAVTGINTFILVFIVHADRRPDWHWVLIFPVLFLWSVVIFLWAAIYFGIHYFEGYQNARLEQLRLEVAAKDSELRTLLSQLNPHFIFNCLNSLRALISEDPSRAQSMVDELSSILRYSLKSGRVETVPLEDEIGAIQAYLKLEIIRFEDRLQVSMDIDPSSLRIEIPPMLLQTLVENGVKHGISRLKQGGEIRVAACVEGQNLRIRVVNSGQLTTADSGATQIGIDNARERLRLLYGTAASLDLRNLDSSSVFAEVLLPVARPRQ
jgi:hypothetical protein